MRCLLSWTWSQCMESPILFSQLHATLQEITRTCCQRCRDGGKQPDCDLKDMLLVCEQERVGHLSHQHKCAIVAARALPVQGDTKASSQVEPSVCPVSEIPALVLFVSHSAQARCRHGAFGYHLQCPSCPRRRKNAVQHLTLPNSSRPDIGTKLLGATDVSLCCASQSGKAVLHLSRALQRPSLSGLADPLRYVVCKPRVSGKCKECECSIFLHA